MALQKYNTMPEIYWATVFDLRVSAKITEKIYVKNKLNKGFSQILPKITKKVQKTGFFTI